MYLGSCMILLCLGHFRMPEMLWTNAADDNSENTSGMPLENLTAGSSSNDPDDEVVIVGTSKSDVVRYFNPVDQVWQCQKCLELNINPVILLQFIQGVKLLGPPLNWIDVEADGNCFYRALSVWVAGTQDYHLIFRMYIIEIVRTDQRIVNFLGQHDYVDYSMWLENNPNAWATEVEIVAATIFLDTSIYVYSEKLQTWDLFKTSKLPLTKADKCIYIQHVQENHYNLVTDVSSDQDLGEINTSAYPGYIMMNPETPTLDHIIQDEMTVGGSQPDGTRFFNPVTAAWQQDKCCKLNMMLVTPFHYNQTAPILKTPKRCVGMEKDKYSFFRALSYCVTGTDYYYESFRQYVSQELDFNQAVKELYEGNEYVDFKQPNTWAIQIQTIAAAVFLNTPIFIYSHDTNLWELYSKNIIDMAPVNTSTEKCIYLSHKAPNEYSVVQDVEELF